MDITIMDRGGATVNKSKKILSIFLAMILILQLGACGFQETAKSAIDTAKTTAENAKGAVVQWYNGIDFSKFEAGWNAAVNWMGSAYSTAANSQFLQTEYIQNVSNTINELANNMNSAYGSHRGIAQEAGFAAEKWVAGTLNIDAAAKGSSDRAWAVNSHKLGSADVATSWGEEASLKYYGSAKAGAKAQAETLIKAYREYASGNSNAKSLQEYMNEHGYDYETQSKLLPLYDGQTRIIPEGQVSEATAYLQGRIDKLSPITGNDAEQLTATYQQTMDSLRDCLTSPDGAKSTPKTYEEMQAIAELSKNGEFKPEDFGLTVSQVIPEKYVVKEVFGTGLEVGILKTIFTIGPDIASIIAEAVKTGNIDEKQLKDTGIAGAISMSEGFVEGSLSRIVITACQEGLLGEALKNASPNIVGAVVFLTIEAIINGYSLAKGEITPEDYGNLMADQVLITVIAMPVTAGLLTILPGTKLFVLAGCMAGGIIACGGYTLAKEATLEFVDGGGFEAIVPVGVANGMDQIKAKVANLNLSDHLTELKDLTVSTAENGYIKIKSVFD